MMNSKTEIFNEGTAEKQPLYDGTDICLDNKYLIYSTVNTTTKQRKELCPLEVEEHIRKHKHGHEGLFGAVKPYFDIDIAY